MPDLAGPRLASSSSGHLVGIVGAALLAVGLLIMMLALTSPGSEALVIVDPLIVIGGLALGAEYRRGHHGRFAHVAAASMPVAIALCRVSPSLALFAIACTVLAVGHVFDRGSGRVVRAIAALAGLANLALAVTIIVAPGELSRELFQFAWASLAGLLAAIAIGL